MVWQHRFTPRPHRSCPSARAETLDQLITQVATGDQHAFARLYDWIVVPLFELALHYTDSHAQAERLTHRMLVELWRSATHYDPTRHNALDWTHRCARTVLTTIAADHPPLPHPRLSAPNE